MKKDDIDKLFSSLEDFSKTPPDDLWNGIEEKLDASKKKKGLAFWWPIAASLVVGLGLLATFYFQSNKTNTLIDAHITPENGVVNQSRELDHINENKNSVRQKETIRENHDSRFLNPNLDGENEKEADANASRVTNSIGSSKNQISKHQKESLATVTRKKSFVLPNEKETQSPIKTNDIFEKENKNAIVEKSAVEKEITNSKEKENLAKTNDLQENALAALANEQQKKEKKEPLEERWSLQVFAGINNSQNLKNQKSLGSTIESQKGYNYGVKTNYKLNRRWAVSTGLKISELGQQVANVSYVNAAKSLVNVSKSSFSTPSKEKGSITNNANYIFIPQNQNDVKNTMSSSFYETADLSQKVQYLEMPMEVSYAILNKGKARVNLNTGGFVGKVISNKVLLNNSTIGENVDVNEVVFGTVLSSTLQYEFFKKTKVFVEPGMNYYTQPVQNQNFNQFQLIFNFGLNVSF